MSTKFHDTNLYDVEPSEPLIPRLLVAIAERDDVDPGRMKPPLATAVDPDALEKLLAGEPADDGGIEIRFTYRGHDVVVRQDGGISID